MEIWIHDKTIESEETAIKGLFKLIVSDKNNKESIPLLLEDSQIEKLMKIIEKSKFDPNMPFNYFKLLIAGCAKYAMKTPKK